MKNWPGGRLVVERLADDDPNLEFYHACSTSSGRKRITVCTSVTCICFTRRRIAAFTRMVCGWRGQSTRH